MKILHIFLLILIVFFTSCKKNKRGGDNTTVITKGTNNLVTLVESDYRPLYHFTPSRNWMNDPNGLVYYKGKYHLFYQYNPNASVWGPMNWGHASSSNLFNWQDIPIALTPDNLGTIFSGSAVVDSNNTSGFKNGVEDPIVAIFTHAGAQQMQSLAYSTDAGLSWTKYSANPVLPNPGLADFRDPKVFWYAPQQKWILILAAADRVKIYSSTNLKNWIFESDFGMGIGSHGGVWECPDLFKLPVDGSGVSKWVLLVSLGGGPNGGTATQYFVGDFDGKNFINSSNNISWVDYGTDDYAGVTYNNIGSADGRRIFIGWMSNWDYAQNVPTYTWRSTMTVPRVLSLTKAGTDYILKSTPVIEISNYKSNTLDTSILNAVSSVHLTDNKIIKSGSYEINFTADLNASNTFSLTLGNAIEKLLVSYDKTANYIVIDRAGSGKVDFNNLLKRKIYCPLTPNSGQATNFQILVDKTSIEIFVDNGSRVITSLFFPNYQYNLLWLQADTNSSAISGFRLQAINKSLIR